MRHATQEKFDRIEIDYPTEEALFYELSLENKKMLPRWG